METLRIVVLTFCIIGFFRFLVWLVSWYAYRHPRVAEITEDDILTLEHEYKKLVEDYRRREKRRSK